MERESDRIAAAYVRLRLAWNDGRLTQQRLSTCLKDYDQTGELKKLTQGTLSRLLNNERWGSEELRKEVLDGLEGMLRDQFGIVYNEETQDYVSADQPGGSLTATMPQAHPDLHPLMIRKTDPLDAVAGTYVLHYRGADPYQGLVRRYFVTIHKNGEAAAYTRKSWTGRAVRYQHLMWVWLWPADSKEVQGTLFFSLDPDKIKGPEELQTFQGLLINTTRNQESISRRIVMIRTQVSDLSRPQGHLSITGDWEDLEEDAPGLRSLFVSQTVNQIRAPRTVNFKHFRSRHDFGRSCFFAACYFAQQQQLPDAKRELEQAFRDGFSDIPTIRTYCEPGEPLEPLRDWIRKNLHKYIFIQPLK